MTTYVLNGYKFDGELVTETSLKIVANNADFQISYGTSTLLPETGFVVADLLPIVESYHFMLGGLSVPLFPNETFVSSISEVGYSSEASMTALSFMNIDSGEIYTFRLSGDVYTTGLPASFDVVESGSFSPNTSIHLNAITDISITQRDVIIGDGGDDFFFGGKGRDLLIGQDGMDFLKGGSGRDKIFGGAGGDVLSGGGGGDSIYGNRGRDHLDGGRGNDKLFGGNGLDILWGSVGDDELTGGKGSDLFAYFWVGDDGIDQITDFEDGIDQIFLRSIRPNKPNQAIVSIESTNDGADTEVILKGGTHILLLDVDSTLITQDDFIFDDLA